MTTQKDDAMWDLIEDTMSSNRTELRAVERELRDRSAPAFLAAEEVDRLHNRAEVIVKSAGGPDCHSAQKPFLRHRAGLQTLAGMSAALLLVLSIAWVDTDKHFNRRPMLARSVDLEQSTSSACSSYSSAELWGVGMQFLTSRHISAVKILLQLRQTATPVGRAADSACQRYCERVQPDAVGTHETIRDLAELAMAKDADAGDRIEAIRKIEWFLTTTEAAAREADASTQERALQKVEFLMGVDRIRKRASEQISNP